MFNATFCLVPSLLFSGSYPHRYQKGSYFSPFLKFLNFTGLPFGIQIAEIINAIIFRNSQVAGLLPDSSKMRKHRFQVRTSILLLPYMYKQRLLTRQLLSNINPYCIVCIEIYRRDSNFTCFLAPLPETQRLFNEFVGILSTFLQILLVILEKIALFFSAISSVAALISFYNKRITVLFIKCVQYEFFSIKNSFYLFSCSYFYVNHIYR